MSITQVTSRRDIVIPGDSFLAVEEDVLLILYIVSITQVTSRGDIVNSEDQEACI